MSTATPVRSLPPNFAQFAAEIASGLEDVYGPAAAEEYTQTAEARFRAALDHRAVFAFHTEHDGEAVGLIMGMIKDGLAHIQFLHVLAPHTGHGIEDALVRRAVSHCKSLDVQAIICDFLPYCPLRLDETFARLGFDSVDRVLMNRSLQDPWPTCAALPSDPLDPGEYEDAAGVLVDTYCDDAGRRLLPEVRTHAAAMAFLATVGDGGYGNIRRQFLRSVTQDGEIAGLIVGSRIAPQTGFVLHVAVHPRHQGCGLGTRLLSDQARAFTEAGYATMSLGVTRTSPARRLYERLGFTTHRQMKAYLWWRPGTE
jgi:ribosomal protein S18 acetylase RimI-like enzyme